VSSISIDPLLGRAVAGKYEIRELLGTGAMGKVYRAYHSGLDKMVAIKVLIRIPGVEEAQARRFRAEARAASRLEHPNSVQILDFGEEPDGLQYIVMELLEGIDLQQLVAEQGPLPTERVAWIMSQVFSALAAAHHSEVIHRDVKPGNIMLVQKSSEDGQIRDFVKVCDFGLAKILDPDANETGGPLTAKGAVFGTPAYMSPEQARGEPLDARSDIYSCGVVMYKMITGHAPFRAESATKVLLGHIHEVPPPLKSWGLPVEPGLEAVVLKAMAKEPQHRYPSARDARDALRALLERLGHAAPPTGVNPTPILPQARAQSMVATEQVRLRSDQADTQATLLATEVMSARPRPSSAVHTQYADTAPPPTPAPRRAPPAAPRAAPLSAPPPPAPGGAAGWALIPGALALIAAAGLVVVLALRHREAPPAGDPAAPSAAGSLAPGPAAQRALEHPDGTPQAGSLGTALASGPAAQRSLEHPDGTPGTPGTALAPGPAAQRALEHPDGTPRTPGTALAPGPAAQGSLEHPDGTPGTPGAALAPGPAAQRSLEHPDRTPQAGSLGTALAPGPAAHPDGTPGTLGAALAPKPESQRSLQAPRPRTPRAPAPQAQAVVLPSPAPPAPPTPAAVAGAALPAPVPAPAPPPPPAALRVDLTRVEVEGAVSRTRSQDALARHVAKAQACLQPLVGPGAEGQVAVAAELDGHGRLGKIEASGLTGAQDCVREAFEAARLPRPDTGGARVRFWLAYRTDSP
jgi:serine/threonine protein kinase